MSYEGIAERERSLAADMTKGGVMTSLEAKEYPDIAGQFPGMLDYNADTDDATTDDPGVGWPDPEPCE